MSELDQTELTPQSKERHSLTLDQRRALRRWANSQVVRPSHKACIEWFEAQYHQTISQSTVSHSLSPKYARLDGDPQLSGSRLRFGNWPDVERLVLLWHQQMVSSGRTPTNDELAEKAKNIFTQLPRYKDETPPEFSPGWIHRFKKRYGLLIRRQRRHGTAPDPANDLAYLVDAVPRFMNVSPETSPAAIRDAVQRVVGVEASLSTCARVRDDIVRAISTTTAARNTQPAAEGDADVYSEDDPEIVLQNALRALQQEEADAEAEAAVVREDREREERGLPPLNRTVTVTNGQAYAQQAAAGALAAAGATAAGRNSSVGPTVTTPSRFAAAPAGADLTLTPIQSAGPESSNERPVRCPFCVNQRLLRTIKEAVEHMSTHVVV